MLARGNFENVGVEVRLQPGNYGFPVCKSVSRNGIAISPHIIIAFIVADDAEIAIFFQRAVAFNVSTFVVNDINMRGFHLISFLDD
jgi:hypothetical protein